jgi:hypothetical protein
MPGLSWGARWATGKSPSTGQTDYLIWADRRLTAKGMTPVKSVWLVDRIALDRVRTVLDDQKETVLTATRKPGGGRHQKRCATT